MNLPSDPVVLRVLVRTHRAVLKRLLRDHKVDSELVMQQQKLLAECDLQLLRVAGDLDCHTPEAWRTDEWMRARNNPKKKGRMK